nr:hypothetical protein [Tanacetum cinerariifolium]
MGTYVSVDNLETDLENKNDKVNTPLSPSPESRTGYIDDLDFFKDFENEFPIIAYDDLKSKSDPLIEPSTLGDSLSMVSTRDDGEALLTSHVWRRLFEFILALGLQIEEELAETGFGAYWSGSERVILDKGDLIDYWIVILSDRDFLGPAPSYVFIRDPAATAGAPGATEDAPAADEGAQAVLALVHAHQPPLPAPQHQTMS